MWKLILICTMYTYCIHQSTCTCNWIFSFTEEPAKKKRRSRWGGEDSRTVIPGLPTVLPSNLSEQQQKLYLCELSTGT